MGIRASLLLLLAQSPFAVLGISSSTTNTFTSQTTTVPSTFSGSYSTAFSTSTLWTKSLSSLIDVPSSILQPKGTNTVTPWDVAFTSPAVTQFPDVADPWSYPTPGPWNASLDPHLVGNGSVKDIKYDLSVGAMAGVVVGAFLLVAALAGISYFFWRRNRSIKLRETEGKGEVTLTEFGKMGNAA